MIWLPAILFALGMGLASWTGCEVTEAKPTPCYLAGLDIGDALSLFGVMGWFLIITVPLMAGTILVGVVWGAALGLRRWKRRHRTTGAGPGSC